jgi:ATP-dependent helicase/nuclease subunit B
VTPTNNYSFYDIEELTGHLQSGHLILTPTFRLARRIKLAWGQHLLAAGNAVWPTPRVMSLEQWWQHCYELAQLREGSLPLLLTPQQELELWQASVESHPQTSALLRPRGAAQQARDAYRNLLLWEIDRREPAIAQQFQFDPDASQFIEWLSGFESELAARGLDILPRIAPQLVAAQQLDTLVLAEFDELPPLYRRLFDKQATTVIEHRSRKHSAECYLQSCDDDSDELARAALWASDRHKNDPAARIGILVSGLDQRRNTVERVLHEAFTPENTPGSRFQKQLFPVNFSAGVALSSCAPVRIALDMLELVAGELSLLRLVGLLHSRYRSADGSAAEQQLLGRLFRDGREVISNSGLRYECSRIKSEAADETEQGLEFGRQLLRLSQQRELGQKHAPSVWTGLFDAALHELGWPGPGPLDSQEYQQVEHWHASLAQLAELDAVCGKLDYRAALRRLLQICAVTVFQPQTPDAPIQILGLLEAAGLQFDHLWLCGMSSGEWPPVASPNPFIPDRLQKQFDMPHASAGRELNYAQSLLDHYTHSTGELVASYSRLKDSVVQQPSPMVAAFNCRDETGESVNPWASFQQAQQGSLEQFVDAVGPTLSEDERRNLRGGSGLIADQSQCPFRAFARHRLKVQALPEPSVGLSASDRGTLLHDAMFHLWGALESRSSLAALSAEKRKDVIALSARQAIESFRIHEDYALARALLDLEQSRLELVIDRWLDVELEREDFEVIAREQDNEIQLGGLKLKLRIDRIDQLANGRQFLIDYKSGSPTISSWLGERPREPQLPLYAELLGDQLEGVAFAAINKHKHEYLGVGQSRTAAGVKDDIAKLRHGGDLTIEDWPALRSHWHDVLGALAQDFMDGRAEVDPVDTRNTCTYCGLEALCRIQ